MHADVPHKARSKLRLRCKAAAAGLSTVTATCRSTPTDGLPVLTAYYWKTPHHNVRNSEASKARPHIGTPSLELQIGLKRLLSPSEKKEFKPGHDVRVPKRH